MQKDGAVWLGELALRTTLDVRPPDLRESRLFANVPDGVSRVELRTRQQQDRIVVERRGSEFMITEPLQSRVTPEVLQTFLALLTSLRATEFTPSKVDPGSAADVHVEVRGAAGTESMDLWYTPSKFVVGHLAPRDVDFAIHPRDFGTLFEEPVQKLRARLLVPVENEAIERVELVAPDEKQPIVLKPGRESSVLQLYSPVEVKADPTAVATLLQALRNLQAIEFVPEGDPAALGLGPGASAFELRVAARHRGAPIVVRLGNDEPPFTYAMRADDDFVVKVPKEVADQVRQPWPTFVDRRVWSIDNAGAVRRMVLARGEQRTTYVRTPNGLGWQREGGSEASAPAADLFERLRDLRATDVLDPASAGDLGAPTELALQRENGDVLHRLSLHRQGERLLAVRPGLAVVYELPQAVAKLIAEL